MHLNVTQAETGVIGNPREIVHLNVTNFAVAVERVTQPELKTRPLVVATARHGRCFVCDISVEAWYGGVRRGMTLKAARRVMPKAKILPARPALYERADYALSRLAGAFSPRVELSPGGHLFLDVSGMGRLFGAPIDLAARLKRECSRKLGLDPGVALASNKLVSKVATRVIKPYGFASVAWGSEIDFLSPHPVKLLPGIGKKLVVRMSSLGIRTLGELSILPDELASAAFGRPGLRLRDYARGIDNSPVTTRDQKELPVTVSDTFRCDSNDPRELELKLYGLIETAGFTLRSRNMESRRIRLRLGYTDSVHSNRQVTLRQGVTSDHELFHYTRALLKQAFTRRVRVRSMTVGFSRLRPACRQLELFSPIRVKFCDRIQAAVDAIKKRFGAAAIRPAFMLDPGRLVNK